MERAKDPRGGVRAVVLAVVAGLLSAGLLGLSFAGRRQAERLAAALQRCELEDRRLEAVFRRQRELRWTALELAAALEERGANLSPSDLVSDPLQAPAWPASRSPEGLFGMKESSVLAERLHVCNERVVLGRRTERGLPELERTVDELEERLASLTGAASDPD